MRSAYLLPLPVAATNVGLFSLQMGLNGVDNGQIWFDNVRVPRDAMLDRCGAQHLFVVHGGYWWHILCRTEIKGVPCMNE